MLLCGIDFETTGLVPATDRIIEAGAVLWDTEANLPIQMLSEFIDPQVEVSAEITAITGITGAMVERYGERESTVIYRIIAMLQMADYGMAHNGTTFDKLFFDAACKRSAIVAPERIWLDTKIDIKFPENITTRNLRHLAAEHSFLNPFCHRAVFDVMTMLKVASYYDLNAIIERAKEPTLYVQALVTFDEKEKAKERGYCWYAPQKLWWREFKESDYLAERDTCGFVTRLLERAPE